MLWFGRRVAPNFAIAIGCSYEPAHRILEDFNKAGGLVMNKELLRPAEVSSRRDCCAKFISKAVMPKPVPSPSAKAMGDAPLLWFIEEAVVLIEVAG